MKSLFCASAAFLLLAAAAGPASADRGDRIETRLDRRGDRIEARFDRRSERADAKGFERRADRLEAKGDRIDQRLDRRGERRHDRFDRRH